MEHVIHLIYLAAAVCFILALKWLSAVPTARRGVITGIIGMLLAVGGTLLKPGIVHGGFHSYQWILVAFAVGTVIGVPMAMMPMTAVPQRTALSHAFGALAAAFEAYERARALPRVVALLQAPEPAEPLLVWLALFLLALVVMCYGKCYCCCCKEESKPQP